VHEVIVQDYLDPYTEGCNHGVNIHRYSTLSIPQIRNVPWNAFVHETPATKKCYRSLCRFLQYSRTPGVAHRISKCGGGVYECAHAGPNSTMASHNYITPKTMRSLSVLGKNRPQTQHSSPSWLLYGGSQASHFYIRMRKQLIRIHEKPFAKALVTEKPQCNDTPTNSLEASKPGK